MLYLTADLHFSHDKIAHIRGYSDGFAMNADIIRVWNAAVRPNDTVYIVGDVSMKWSFDVESALNALHGHIFLVPGNHDHRKDLKRYGEIVTVLSRLEVVKRKQISHLSDGKCDFSLALCHYPMLCWPGDALAYGHLHGDTQRHGMNGCCLGENAVDVGWDVWKRPVAVYEAFSGVRAAE